MTALPSPRDLLATGSLHIDGQPGTGVMLVAYFGDQEHVLTRVDRAGSFELEGLPRTTFTLEVLDASRRSFRFNQPNVLWRRVLDGSDALPVLNLALPVGGIEGVVRDGAGAPLSSVPVVLKGVIADVDGGAPIENLHVDRTDADGVYRFDKLPPGT